MSAGSRRGGNSCQFRSFQTSCQLARDGVVTVTTSMLSSVASAPVMVATRTREPSSTAIGHVVSSNMRNHLTPLHSRRARCGFSPPPGTLNVCTTAPSSSVWSSPAAPAVDARSRRLRVGGVRRSLMSWPTIDGARSLGITCDRRARACGAQTIATDRHPIAS